MSNKNLTVDLRGKLDKEKRTYYVGKLKFPGTIDCSKGVAFLIFIAENGSEQLQIAPMDKNDDFED